WGIPRTNSTGSRVAGIAELHRKTQLRRGSPVPANQPQVVVRERVETGQGALIKAGRKFGELGALRQSEQLAGGHGGLEYAVELPQKTASFLRQRYPGRVPPNDDAQSLQPSTCPHLLR